MKHYRYVIVGASIAGLSAVQGIRSRDPRGEILVVHGESRLPYKRTQLSKQIARGFSGDQLAIHPPDWYSANGIELLRGTRAISLQPSSRELALSTEDVVGYETLLIATGASPVALAIPGTQHLEYLRDIVQAEAIMRRLKEVDEAVSIGFGVQGVELADQFASAGIATTLLGCNDRLMSNCLDAETGRRLEDRAVAAGVRVVRWGKVREIRREGRRYEVVAEEGEIETGMAAASVGAVPVVDIAVSAGLPVEEGGQGGVIVQTDMRTGVEGIFAAGDAAAPLPGASWGLWHSAEASGMTAGVNMAGGDLRPDPKPFRLKCEAFGGWLFSLNYARVSADEQAEPCLLRNSPDLYLRVWEREGRTVGALLDLYPRPDPPRTKALGKQLERLIGEGAGAGDILRALGT
ncbi:MAG TPA: NAD(P)/FAD-dependent oxidoreductase [Spirochaetia bacterium]|nr:NAD(P)/FAD-dependent oxidoreductase [Spirochaetia bacterium]